MKNIKKYLILVISIVLIILLFKNILKKENISETENNIEGQVVEKETQEKLEKVNVTGYHLVTYAQSSNVNSFIKTLDVKMEQEAKIRFVIGSIDEENFVDERISFELELDKGDNKLELLEKRYMLKENEYLFMDISDYNILYKQAETQAKTLVQNESNKVLGKLIVTESDYILPFKYTLEKVEEYNVLVIGNDITTKNGSTGSAATEETKDYYYLTKTRLENIFEKVNINRINAKTWEQTQNKQDWLNKNLSKDQLENLDLVIFQLGDNYSKEADFESGVTEIVDHVKTYSPNAEMLWLGIWFVDEKNLNSLPGICERLNIEFVNISDLSIPEYQSSIKEISNNYNQLAVLEEAFYPNNEAMQIISNRIIEKLKFDFEQ